MSGKNPAGNVTSQAALADYIDRLIPLYFIQPCPQFIYGNIFEPVNMSIAVFSCRSGIQQSRAPVMGKTVYVF